MRLKSVFKKVAYLQSGNNLQYKFSENAAFNLPLLAADVTLDVARLSLEHVLVLCVTLLVLVTVIFINGISIKLGDKEVNIGGMYRLLAKKDEDILLKETLHNFSEDVDHEVNGDLYDLVDNLNYEIEEIALKNQCYFTFEKFTSVLKTELEKRVRRNNLKEKLAKTNWEKYADTIMQNVETKYKKLQAKVNYLNCGESYADFSIIKNAAREIVNKFIDGSKEILIKGCRKKLERYEKDKGNFKTAAARRSSCEYPTEKNKGYIEKLEGNYKC